MSTNSNPPKKNKENGRFVKPEIICEEKSLMTDLVSGDKEFIDIRKKQATVSYDNINFAEGKNSAYIKALMQTIAFSEGVDLNNVDDMRYRFYSYMKYCAENDLKLGNQAAYASFGCSKVVADQWSRGLCGKEKQDFILEVKRICSAYRECAAQDGSINPAIAIFWAKNFDGMVDAPTEQVVETNPLGERKSATDLAEKYADLED